MKLKRLEVTGFKSFSGKQAFHFEHPVTAIVGPNGSGKSNIREALSFVLGEQSLKTLRGRRSEDLIFNGSKALPRLNRASVKVVFDNTARVIPNAFDEIEIERVVHRDSSNQYFINSSAVRLKDVGDLLSRAKIGGGSHHTISQGEADRALKLSPKERRALIEESLGLSFPQGQKREAVVRLEKTRENIREAEIRRREHLPHLRYLEREMKMIEERDALARELLEKLKAFVPRKRHHFGVEKERIAVEIETAANELRDLQERVESRPDSEGSNEAPGREFDEKIRELGARKDELNRSLGKLEAELEAAERSPETHAPLERDVRRALESTRNELRNALSYDSFESVKHAVEKLLTSLDALFENQHREPEHNEDHINATRQSIEALRRDIEALAEEERNAEEQNKELERAHYARMAEAKAAEEGREALFAQIRSLESLKSRLERQEEDIRRAEEQFKDDIRAWAFLLNSSSFLDERRASDDGASPESDLHAFEREVEKQVLRVESMNVGNRDEIMREHEKARTHHDFLEREIQDLKDTSEKLERVIVELTEKINATFSEGLTSINEHFNHFFKKMFEGGTAKLIEIETERNLPDGTTEKEKGIEIKVELGHKRVRSLAMLSGGERTLASMALISALSATTPPPFLILDEADAALDEANSRRYGDLVAELAKQSQLILITHNRETMSRAGRLYGITMGKRASSELLSIDLGEAEDFAR